MELYGSLTLLRCIHFWLLPYEFLHFSFTSAVPAKQLMNALNLEGSECCDYAQLSEIALAS